MGQEEMRFHRVKRDREGNLLQITMEIDGKLVDFKYEAEK